MTDIPQLQCCNDAACTLGLTQPQAPQLDIVSAVLHGQVQNVPTPISSAATPAPQATTICHWQNCHRQFDNMTTLLAHIASDHLGALPEPSSAPQPPPAPAPTPQALPQQQPQVMGNALDTLSMNMNMAQMVSQQPAQQQFRQPEMPSGDLFSCLWDDCFPTLSDPAAAQGHNHAHAHPHPHPHVKSDAPLTPETMLRHLLQEHLGVPLPNGEVKPHDAHHAHPHPHTHNCDHAAKAESHPAPHSHHHEHAHPHRDHHHHVGPRHKRQYPMACQWPGCTVQEPFTSSAELMEHLSEVHVGRGQDKYACHWGQCGSGQGRMFSSRQKVLRHLQSHIGHRPFVCSVCGQGFSEAAPLAAHMRRHTDDSEYGPRLPSFQTVIS